MFLGEVLVNKPVLDVHNLVIKVGENTLIDRISFSIQPGEIFALVGESGSGKSLTSLAIMRLLPEALNIEAGEIQLHQKSLLSLSEAQMQKVRGKSVAMIFQEPMTSLNPVMRVGDQVSEVLRVHLGLSSKHAKLRTIELFNEVGIPEAADRVDWYPHQLSGGQKQRVMIAMALACEPDLLIADEPTTALDVTIQAQVLALLKKLRDERGLSILFITHDMGVVAQMADRVAVMQKGKILETAECEHFIKAPTHPYTQQLLADALPTRDYKPATSQDSLLDLRGLKVHFPIKKGLLQRTVGYVKAVDGVDLVINRGETLALVGESGSGKSTIGQAILRLIDSTDGEIRYQDVDLAKLKENKIKPLRQKIQVIFQDPYSALNPRMTIGEIIREGMVSLKVGPQKKADQDARITELLTQVGLLPEHKQRYPHEFSGGQRQRIGIARALAVEPELIICDEPTSALDVTVRAQVLDLLNNLQKTYNLSLLFITHDLSIIPRIAHRVAVMSEGRIVEQGEVQSILENPQHHYTQTLLAAAPSFHDIQHSL